MRLHKMLPNGKSDLNNFGAVSTDLIGGSDKWPEGDAQTRERLFQEHLRYNLGMLCFLSRDERVPLEIRRINQKIGEMQK